MTEPITINDETEDGEHIQHKVAAVEEIINGYVLQCFCGKKIFISFEQSQEIADSALRGTRMQ